ncbi:MAG TPA: hypothetical protein VLC54_11675 [Anaeromyxobacter sp.]|nr:hypothetical protein [Anaeromyxobacter sp.]
MKWLLLAVVVLGFAIRFARRHRHLAVSPSDPVSTLHLDMSRKQSKETKAALDAASSTLR